MDAVTHLKEASNALADAAETFTGDDDPEGPYRRIRELQDQVDELVTELA